MFELMVMTMLRFLQLHPVVGINRSASEWHDTDETTVNLLAFRRGGTWVRLDDREAKNFPESIGDRNGLSTNGTTTEMRAVRLSGTTSVSNLGDSRREMGDMRVVAAIGIGHSVSKT
jgi:hypothetical protein